MLYSVYSTDEAEVRRAVLDQACEAAGAGGERGDGPVLFTSLHMPEESDLASWVAWMGRAHRECGARFWADISPLTYERLGFAHTDHRGLREAGVAGLRVDFGFSAEQIVEIGRAGMPVAINASTVGAPELDAFVEAGIGIVGWHNFYPRPGTGLAEEYYLSSSRLFLERGLRLLAFIPGETSWRAPLHRGLPTLETHRYRNAYVTAMELKALTPGVEVVCAEGNLNPQHLQWLELAEEAGVVTLPLADLHSECSWLAEGQWRLRVEETGASHRLEASRGRALPKLCVPADAIEEGSLQMDTLGRYAGEVHLFVRARPLDGDYLRIGDVAAPYRGLVKLLHGGQAVRFVRA